VLLFVVVTHVIGSFQVFGQVFILTRAGPGDATRTVVQHLYETAFRNFFQFGSASAMAWVLFAIILGFSAIQFRLLRGTRVLSMRPVMVGAGRWRRRALSAALVLFALLWLLPAVWCRDLSQATENIVRVPPEWIPRPATLAHYGEVLFSSSRTARIGARS
jgi:ABC-type Fe3+ transport system permease subunit